jgi:hypothetical protein
MASTHLKPSHTALARRENLFLRARALCTSCERNVASEQEGAFTQRLEQHGAVRSPTTRFKATVVRESNDKPLFVLDEHGEEFELVSLSVHEMNESSAIVEQFGARERGVCPAL